MYSYLVGLNVYILAWSLGYKTSFMFNWTVILFINVKMPKTVGILTVISSIDTGIDISSGCFQTSNVFIVKFKFL